MSNEEYYDNDIDATEDQAQVGAELGSDDYEVELHRRAPKGDVFLQVFPRTRHWVRAAVRPETILREDKEDLVFSFVKRMKDPSFSADDGIRYVTFRCNVALSELEIEMSFTHIEVAYQDLDGNLSESTRLTEDSEECADVKSLFEKVIANLASYLSKAH